MHDIFFPKVMELVFKATDYGSTCPTGTPSALEICTKWNIKLPVPVSTAFLLTCRLLYSFCLVQTPLFCLLKKKMWMTNSFVRCRWLQGNGCPPGEDDCYVTMCSTVMNLWSCGALQAYTEAKAFCQNKFCPRLCHGMNCQSTTAAGGDDDDDGGDADSLEFGITNDSQYTTGVTIATVASVSVIVIIAVVVIVALLRQRSRRTTESLSIHSQDKALVQ